MKITFEEAEIIKSIQDSVTDQMEVGEDQSIIVELTKKAGKIEANVRVILTADIGKEPVKAAKVPKVASTGTGTGRRGRPRKNPVEVAVTQAPVENAPVPTEAPANLATAQAEVVAETKAPEVQDAPAVTEQEPTPVANTAPKNSLFGNMKKPVNE